MNLSRLIYPVVCIGLAAHSVSAQVQKAEPQECATFDELGYDGFYTDKTSYKAGDTVTIHGHWPGEKVKYRIVQIGPDGNDPHDFTHIADVSGTVDFSSATYEPPFGSFVEFAGSGDADVDLSDVSLFTIEGWAQPTYLWPSGHLGSGDDDEVGAVIVAGQIEWDDANSEFTGVGIGIRDTGEPFGIASVVKNGNPNDTDIMVVESDTALTEGDWAYLALTMFEHQSKTKLRLWVGTESTWVAIDKTVEQSSDDYLVQDVSDLSFRLGARAEAPGIDTGCFSGRLARWGAWDNEALTLGELKRRQWFGWTTEELQPADRPEEDAMLKANFADVYGNTVTNSGEKEPAGAGSKYSDGAIIGHATPGMAGRPSDSQGIRLNHDQLVDAAYEDTKTYTLPTGGSALDSGYYAVQAVFDVGTGGTPDYDETAAVNTEASHYTCFIIRPDIDEVDLEDRNPVAVIVPVNTWMAYNAWPGDFGAYEDGCGTAKDLELRPSTGSQYYSQGNNAAYGMMGDGVSPGHYIGWQRPNINASPVVSEEFFNWRHARWISR